MVRSGLRLLLLLLQLMQLAAIILTRFDSRIQMLLVFGHW